MRATAEAARATAEAARATAEAARATAADNHLNVGEGSIFDFSYITTHVVNNGSGICLMIDRLYKNLTIDNDELKSDGFVSPSMYFFLNDISLIS